MSKINDKLHAVHSAVHSKGMGVKKKYSYAIYTGGVDVASWSSLSDEEQSLALSKQWYIRWNFRNPYNNKLERQDNIKVGNEFKTKNERLKILKQYQEHLIEVLNNGFNPYQEDDLLEEKEERNTGELLDYALSIKESSVSKTTHDGYRFSLGRFKEYLKTKSLLKASINSVTKKVVMSYLNKIAKDVSPASRNSDKTNLSALFTVLYDNDIIQVNFIKDIKLLRTPKQRDRTYSESDLEIILKCVAEKDPILLLYIKFVSYFFWRPVENVRIKISDIDLKGRLMTDKTKTDSLKTKIIPDIIYKDLSDYMDLFPDKNNNDYLFTPNGIGAWNATEITRRGAFGKTFKKIKESLGYGAEYTIYSFRHTYITKAYIYLRTVEKLSIEKSIEVLSGITGHKSSAILKYIHYIDAERPDDYSKMVR